MENELLGIGPRAALSGLPVPLPDEFGRSLAAMLTATDWRARGTHLASALDLRVDAQAQAGLPAVTPACVPFWDRPFLHLDPRLVPGLRARVRDPEIRAEPVGLGSIEQRSDNVDLLLPTRRRREALGLPGG